MNVRHIALSLAASAAVASVSLAPRQRPEQEVPSVSVAKCRRRVLTLRDGSTVTFASLSYRDYTTWLRDDLAVRSIATLTLSARVPRRQSPWPAPVSGTDDQDLVTGESGRRGQFHVDLPDGGPSSARASGPGQRAAGV